MSGLIWRFGISLDFVGLGDVVISFPKGICKKKKEGQKLVKGKEEKRRFY